MKKHIQTILASLAVIAAVLLPISTPATVGAVNPGFGACTGNANTAVCRGRNDDVFAILKSVINILLTIVGIVAVIMIIVGGLKYVTSAGDSNGVNSAKNTVLYAVVGLVIASMAYAIVNFVLGKI